MNVVNILVVERLPRPDDLAGKIVRRDTGRRCQELTALVGGEHTDLPIARDGRLRTSVGHSLSARYR